MLALYLGFAGAAGAFHAYTEFASDLPDGLQKMRVAPNRATQVYSADGELIGEFFLERRIEVSLEQIPLLVQRAFISAEDRRFWEHPGFDLSGIARAMWANYRGTGTRQGASTITQQVTRMLLLSNERTYSRKIKELILSTRVERQLSKRDILEIYLNRVYLGHGAYGVQAAAQVYFGKDVTHLSPGEAALLAGLTQAPSAYSPYGNLSASRVRQSYVLERMRKDGYLTANQVGIALDEPLALVDPDLPLNHVAAPYFVEHVRQWAEREYGHRRVLRDGLRIYTTLDTRAQRSAEAAVRDGLEDLDRRIGFRGPVGHLEKDEIAFFVEGPPRPYRPGSQSTPLGEGAALLAEVPYQAVVTEITKRKEVIVDAGPMALPMVKDDARRMLRWRGERPEKKKARPRLAVGDVIPVELTSGAKDRPAFALAQTPEVQGALVSIEPQTGRVIAMVGGYSFEQSRFNRATQARRQIGSAMKPFIYLTALLRGRSQMDIVVDAPVKVRTASGVWSPKNYDGEYKGPMTLRTALAKSINTVSVRLVLQVGVDAIIENMRRLGIRTKFTRHVSMALGTPDLTLMEVAAATSAFANGGRRVYPRFVERVVTSDGTVLMDRRHVRPTTQVLAPEYAYLIVDMMKAVVERGTGRKALVLKRPAAGKTGTSTGHRDAWFIGYTPDLLAGVWVGRDNFTKPIGARATGGSAALPIWVQFMRAAHPDTPPRDFKVPEDIIFVRANELTGMPAPPGPSSRWIPFARGTVPRRFADAARTLRFERSSPLTPEAPP